MSTPKMTPPLRHCRRQTGVSLIELLIGITIGLMVVLAALGSLAFTRAASRGANDSIRLQQDASAAFLRIGNAIRQAGAHSLVTPLADSTRVVFNMGYLGLDNNAADKFHIRGSDGPNTGPDTLELSHDADSSSTGTDCLGEAPPAAVSITSVFTVSDGALRCDGSGKTTTSSSPLVMGAEDFQVWYGLRDGTTGLRYLTAAQMRLDATPKWHQVEAIRVCLRLAGELGDHPTATTRGCRGETVASDGRLRRTQFRVFKLRNLGS